MKATEEPSNNRRTFIKTCLRLGAGSGLLIAAAVLGLRDKKSEADEDVCQSRIPCKGCTKFSGCGLSRARQIKNTAKGEGVRRAET